MWRNRDNHGIYTLYKEMERTRDIRWGRLQWVGHAMRMKDERVPKKATKGKTSWKAQRRMVRCSGQGR
jgi:hypothetical protein